MCHPTVNSKPPSDLNDHPEKNKVAFLSSFLLELYWCRELFLPEATLG